MLLWLQKLNCLNWEKKKALSVTERMNEYLPVRIHISEKEVIRTAMKRKYKKITGFHDVNTEMIKQDGKAVVEWLFRLRNIILSKQETI